MNVWTDKSKEQGVVAKNHKAIPLSSEEVDRWHLNFLIIVSRANNNCADDQLQWEEDRHQFYLCITCILVWDTPNYSTDLSVSLPLMYFVVHSHSRETGTVSTTPPSLSPVQFYIPLCSCSQVDGSVALPVMSSVPNLFLCSFCIPPILFNSFQAYAFVSFLSFSF